MNTAIEINEFVADILIVDDKLENIRFLSDFLSQQQYQVRKAINGQAALTAVKTMTPDLILLDINMPGMTGYEVCQTLKDDSQTSLIPVIFLSAGNNLEDKIQAFKSGGADYITKPFQLEEVLARVQTQLTIHALQKKLEAKNLQLGQALESLKKAQEALVQQEKMATLRKVVAGIAHEVNNPLNFIAGNVKPVSSYVDALLEIIQLYQQKYGDRDPEIQALLEENDLEFVSDDLNKITHSIKAGADRIRAVVLALQSFTRLDEVGMKFIPVQDSIESALMILHHRLQPEQGLRITVQKFYGELPLICGYADQLNQVMFHLLDNAIDAIAEKADQNPNAPFSPTISIVTGVEDQQVMIKIQDSGIGIPETTKRFMFEPFFTTKAAGRGIGLGLATSRRVIEEIHQGRLQYQSLADGGTEFSIALPITTYCG